MRILRKILTVLNRSERRRGYVILLLDNVIGLVDVAFLAGLLYVINLYAKPQKSLLPITCFLLLFLLKSTMGYVILRARYRFIFGVASRLSETNMLRYLEGSYMNYVGVDSSVHIRK